MASLPPSLGRYRPLQVLGKGAMGLVYLAEDPLLKRAVAIKVVQLPEARRDEVLHRFRQEAEISARLNHPNVITVYDVGEDPVEGPYLAMEFVDGEGLDLILSRGPLTPEVAMDILLQGMEALEAAHAAGIIHRDVKPANFLVGRDGRVRLTDFGISREGDSTWTMSGGFMGSPAFAAPELFHHARANEATDRWSFVVTAYQCLTGRLPFRGENLSTVLYQVAHGDASFPTDLDPALAGLFKRALARDLSERPTGLHPFMVDLLKALDLPAESRARFLVRLGGSPHPGRAFPRWHGIAQTLRRHPRLGVAVGLLLGGALWALLQPAPALRLRLESNPPGARVQVDGRQMGLTPLADIALPAGAKQVRFDLDGYWPQDLPVPRRSGTLRADLLPTPYFLDLDSLPSGAEVYLNGVLKGRTPLKALQVEGPSGQALELRAPGHQPWRTVLERRSPPLRPIRLEPEP